MSGPRRTGWSLLRDPERLTAARGATLPPLTAMRRSLSLVRGTPVPATARALESAPRLPNLRQTLVPRGREGKKLVGDAVQRKGTLI